MKFAFSPSKDRRIEATKGAKGICTFCDSELIAKCGEVYSHHWAHKKKCNDHFWENETEWHRNWKNQFPKEWQEVIHHDESGEKHIADVKTSEGWVIEFQHSYLKPEERRSRNNFYEYLIWVVDGTRRPTDAKQFKKILDEAKVMVSDRYPPKKLIRTIHYIHTMIMEECKLFKEWDNNSSLVLLDFNDCLVLMYPRVYCNKIFFSELSRSIFIELINNNQLDEFITKTLIPYGKFFVEQTGWPPDHISRYNFRTIEGFEKICIREKQNYK